MPLFPHGQLLSLQVEPHARPRAFVMYVARVLLPLIVLSASPCLAERRFALVVGVDKGWDEDLKLNHTQNDVEKVAETLVALGDFPQENVRRLVNPSSQELVSKLEEIARSLGDAREDSFFIFYYSGHADAKQLHLANRTGLAHNELFQRIKSMPASLKLGILDACQSGGILSKGGRRGRQLGVRQASNGGNMKGTVILTSSGADEQSQESNSLGGSLFSHHLISGLSGPADENEDGEVRLDEAYRYALARTEDDALSKGAGSQKPRISTELKGYGDVVLTQLNREKLARLLVRLRDESCFVLNESERLIKVEARSGMERVAVVRIPRGRYVLKCRNSKEMRVARFEVREGQEIDAEKLSFEKKASEDGILPKGGQDAVLRRDLLECGERELKEGRFQKALDCFARLEWLDPEDAQSYQGRARVYRKMAEHERSLGHPNLAKRYERAADLVGPRGPAETSATKQDGGVQKDQRDGGT